MNKHTENLNSIIEEVDSCNNYFDNHVSIHNNDYIRKGIFVLQALAIVGILILLL